MSEKLSDWFSGKPDLVGVYQTLPTTSDVEPCFQHWNGKIWGLCSTTAKRAEREAADASLFQTPRWRGLAENPEA